MTRCIGVKITLEENEGKDQKKKSQENNRRRGDQDRRGEATELGRHS
jgi:hypothetical protein